MALERFANTPTPSSPSTAWTTLVAGIDASVTSLTVVSFAPFPSAAQYRILIDNELLLVTAGGGTTTWTVTRGVEGSTAAVHALGASIFHILTAAAVALSPRSMTTAGDTEYLGSTGAPTRLASPGDGNYVVAWTSAVPSWVVASVGSGDVVGPAVSVDNAIVRFDGTTGKLVQGYTSGAPTISDTGVITATSPMFTTPTIGAAAFTTLIGGAAPTPMQIGAAISTNYSAVSFNNVVTTVGINGIWGGNDGALVFNVPSGGAMYFRFANGTAYTMTAAGDILGAGVLTATTATFTTPATNPILINNVSDSTSDGLISLNNNRTRAGLQGIWGGSSGAMVYNTPAGGTMYWRVANSTAFILDGAGVTVSVPTAFDGSSYLQFTERGTPSASPANTVRFYSDDNGSGKTRLMAIFPSGVAQQIAVEP